MPIWEHLTELRSRLLVLVVLWVCFALFSYFFLLPRSVEILYTLARLPSLYVFSPLEPFYLKIKISLIIAFAMVLPFIVYQIWRFIHPALHKSTERSLGWMVAFGSLGFFVVGLIVGVFQLGPFSLRVLTSATVVQPFTMMLSAESVFSFLLMMGVICGFVFEVPLILMIAGRLNLIQYATLAKRRKEVLLAILIILAVLTPTGDAVTLAVTTVAGYLLWEIGLLFLRFKK